MTLETSRSTPSRTPVSGTFVVTTRRREVRDSSLMRTHARPRAELESPRARAPYTARCELPPGTRLLTGAHVKYWNRSPSAYGHRRSSAGTPRLYVEDPVPGTMHPRISLPWISPPGGRRMPAERPSARSAQSLPRIRIAIVSHPHAPSIIAPWQGSGRRSDSGQPLRHDGDRRTA